MGMVRWRRDRARLTCVAELRALREDNEEKRYFVLSKIKQGCLNLERTKYFPSVGAELLKQKR